MIVGTRSKAVAAPSEAEGVALIVVCHADYLGFLPALLAAWDGLSRGRLAEKHLVLDGCNYTPPVGWVVTRGKWGNPGGARNEGLSRVRAQWVIYWDADNLPSEPLVEAYLRVALTNASSSLGIAYPMVNGHSPWTDDPRLAPFVDTASIWRRQAILDAGGWKDVNTMMEDYGLALAVLRAGWRCTRLQTSLEWNQHSLNRSHTLETVDATYRVMSVGIVTPISGLHTLNPWLESVLQHDLPSRCGITLLINNPDPKIRKALRHAVARMGRELAEKFTRVTTIDVFACPRNIPEEDQEFLRVQSRVGRAYAIGLSATPEEIILTWEEDVLPLSQDALRRLFPVLRGRGCAGVGAAVPNRDGTKWIATHYTKPSRVKWVNEITAQKMPWLPIPVGMLGGGFTAWNRAILEQIGFTGAYVTNDQFPLGWDGWLCKRLNAAGYRVVVHGGVECDHRGVRIHRIQE